MSTHMRRFNSVVTRDPYELGGGAIDVQFEYTPADPYAVTMKTFQGYDTTEWIFARALLVEGLSGISGESDVIVWKSYEDVRDAYIQLSSPFGTAYLRFDRYVLQSWVESTYRVHEDSLSEDELNGLVSNFTDSMTE